MVLSSRKEISRDYVPSDEVKLLMSADPFLWTVHLITLSTYPPVNIRSSVSFEIDRSLS
jgi:hypothetical protein